jgi:glyoxylase-like metal-dependent hydrolase (beta-lactamase superfamily II)
MEVADTGDPSRRSAMAPIDVAEVGDGVYRIDLFERGRTQRNACYVVDGGEAVALVEVGSGPSIPSLVGGLHALGVAPERIRWIVVSHVHLDHAGAAGALAQRWPWVRVAVHPEGARHLIDPRRLEESSRSVYGDKRFEALFGPLRAIPAERVWPAPDGGALDLSGRVLTVLHTPGHAHHHMALEDGRSGGIFTGDGAGIVYPSLWPWHLGGFHLPNTTPPRFDPDAMVASLERLVARRPKRLYITHFGPVAPADLFLRECAQVVREWQALGMAATSLDEVRASLRASIEAELHAHGVHDLAAAWHAADLDLDLDLNSKGLWAYAQRQRTLAT